MVITTNIGIIWILTVITDPVTDREIMMKPLNPHLVELVKLLNDREYHDGTAIGEHLCISRAAVWKLVKKLEHHGIALTCTKGKGYRMDSPLILLDSRRLSSQLRHRCVTLMVLEKTPSTNHDVRLLEGKCQGVVACLAETQLAGKGRFQRAWHSPFADNLYLSLRFDVEKDISELSGLSLIVSLAICHAIELSIPLSEKKLAIKWPNDILIDGCKLAGVLVEIQAESHGCCQVIVGIGINVNMRKALKKEISQSWVSLSKITNQYIDRHALCVEVIDTVIDYLERFSNQGLKAFMSEWKKRDYYSGETISVVSGKKKTDGLYQGITDQGHLKILTRKGEQLTFSSGDASLLK